MKRSGFKRLTFAEAMAKQREAQDRRAQKPKPEKKAKVPGKKKVKHPTILGIKSRRYVGIKGCLWAIFSDYIRKRDFILYNGRCVSCPRIVEDWKLADPGHYVAVARGNFRNIFSEQGVNLQCKRCNNPDWTPDASIPYAYELDRRYGAGTADRIVKESEGYAGSYSELQYMEQIELYKEKFARL